MASPYKVEHISGISVVTVLPDRVFYEKHDQFLQDFKILIAKSPGKFILDMGHVDYLSSLMLSSLVYIHQKVVENEGELIMCSLSQRALDVISIMHLDSLFVIVPDRARAMQSFSTGFEPIAHLRRQLPSQVESIPSFINEAIDFINKYIILNADQIFDMKLALEEALTNAIKHGNQYHPQRLVDVDISIEDAHLRIVVCNEGEGFDPNNVPDPTLPSGLTKTSGRGVFLIKKIMDKVVYSDQGRCLTMIKSL